MTLRRKLAYQITILVASLLAAGVGSIWQINAMRSDFDDALSDYQRLNKLYEVGTFVAAARLYLSIAHPEPANAHIQLSMALKHFNDGFPADAPSLDAALEQTVRSSLQNATSSESFEGPENLDGVVKSMIDLDVESRQAIQSAYERANHHLELLMISMSGLLVGGALMAMIIGIAQYRAILWPLARMKLAVERIAAGRFNGRVDTEGTLEFAELAVNFNRMATRLEDLYHNLQQRVEAKSRQLVRNERLASVGLLAAGVAHEINNPLSIMTAHAELSLGTLVREQVASVSAMPEYHDRILTVKPANGIDDRIKGRSDEIKQVVLNLLFNALEATSSGGEVHVEIGADRREVELNVIDTGKGMPEGVLDQIFEPFYTDNRGKTATTVEARRGVGLGLSIVHAIVVRHGGEIRAHSDGPGRGSRFTVVLPTASFDLDEEMD